MTDSKKLLTVPEVADLLNLAEITIRKMVCAKKIPYYKLGSSVRFSYAQIFEFMEQHAVKPISSKRS